MFLASRMPGFMAHWREAMNEFASGLKINCQCSLDIANLDVLPAQPIKLWRPNQVFVGTKAKENWTPDLKTKI